MAELQLKILIVSLKDSILNSQTQLKQNQSLIILKLRKNVILILESKMDYSASKQAQTNPINANSKFKIRARAQAVGPVVSPKNIRILDSSYFSAVEVLCSSTTEEIFGKVDVREILSMAFLTIGLFSEEGNLLASMSVNRFPNIAAIPSWDWYDWIENLYHLEGVTAMNSLWIHHLAWSPNFSTIFLKPFMVFLFSSIKWLQYMFLIIPPGSPRYEFLEAMGTRVLPKKVRMLMTNPQVIVMWVRQHFTKHYKIRRAVEEDNDDLIPLIHSHSERLLEYYGSYYIAELLTRHKDCGRQIIVAEYESTAVAVLILNDTINYNELLDQFELVPFNGLKRPHPNDHDHQQEDFKEALQNVMEKWTEDDYIRLGIDDVDDSSEGTGEFIFEVSSSDESDYSFIVSGNNVYVFEENEARSFFTFTEREATPSFKILTEPISDYVSKEGQKKKTLTDIPSRGSRFSINYQGRFSEVEYFGGPNAFAIEIIAAQPGHDDALISLFEAMYECFPDRSYAVLSTPTTVPPSTVVKYFLRVTPKREGNFPHELYLLHKNVILSNMEVKEATYEHLDEIETLLKFLPKSTTVLKRLKESLEETSILSSYVLFTEDQIVGIAVIDEETKVDYLQTHYSLDTWMDTNYHKNGMHGLIKDLVISPVFQTMGAFFLSEIHRQSGYSALYHKIRRNETLTAFRESPFISVLNYLIPVKPRNLPVYNLDNLEGCSPSADVSRVDDPFALYVSLMRFCSMTRIEVNTRIVIVGSSATALFFLESLILTPSKNYQVKFNNVCLVCPHGISVQKVPTAIRENMFVKKGVLDEHYLALMSFKTHVNVVQGIMTDINRKEQYIVVDNDSFLPYDLLFLACGEQFQKPIMPNSKALPSNLYVINTPFDANTALQKMRYQSSMLPIGKDVHIIVYGHYLQSLCCIRTLLICDVPPKRIVFVDPFPPKNTGHRKKHKVTFFNDIDIEESVYHEIEELGIKIYRSYYFVKWVLDLSGDIKSVVFESQHRIVEVPCFGMYMYDVKTVSPTTFQAIIKAGLVFDGRLVIDQKCRTNDKRIYGAGTLTKYSGKFYADDLLQKYFNREEVGSALGAQIKEMLIPEFLRRIDKCQMKKSLTYKRGEYLVARYEKPVINYCRLPGSMEYLSVTKPGKRIPLETALNNPNYGIVMKTGNIFNLATKGFFKLHINQYRRVETITCLSKKPIKMSNLVTLWGKHEKLLNNLCLRFEMSLIKDFFEYFDEAWCYALYNDRFPNFLADLDDTTLKLTSLNGDVPILDFLKKLYTDNNWQPLTEEQQKFFEEEFVYSTATIQDMVIEFLKKNYEHLPMYATPNLVRKLLMGYENSALFAPY